MTQFNDPPSNGAFFVSLNNGDLVLKVYIDRVLLDRDDIEAVANELRELATWLETQRSIFDK